MKEFRDFFLISLYRKIAPMSIKEKFWRIHTGIMKNSFIGIFLRTLIKRILYLKSYNSVKLLPDGYPKTVVYMADGSEICGGLSSRLRSLVSCYKLCKELNIRFKLNFTSPFNLNEYLLPNTYDWYISPDEICYNPKYAKPCFLSSTYSRDYDDQIFWTKYFLKENYKQIHVYSDINFVEKEYGVLFRELFKVSDELETLIDYHVKILGGGGGDLSLWLLDFYSYWATLRNMAVYPYCRIMKREF